MSRDILQNPVIIQFLIFNIGIKEFIGITMSAAAAGEMHRLNNSAGTLRKMTSASLSPVT